MFMSLLCSWNGALGFLPGTQSKQREVSLAIRICLQMRRALSFLAIEYVRSNHNAANDNPDDTERVLSSSCVNIMGV